VCGSCKYFCLFGWLPAQPYKRENKHTRARDVSRSSFDASDSEAEASVSDGGATDVDARLPQVGDVVSKPSLTAWV
jgi:hypothetical protein